MKVQLMMLTVMAVVFMCAADSSVAQRYGAEATLRFCVKEADGKPLAGVHVKATEGASFDVVTDADGVATASGIMRERIRYSVESDGVYAHANGLQFEKTTEDGQRWVWDRLIEVTLRRKVSPHPMRTVRISDVTIPVINRPVGFDLLKGSFLPPYGDGETADFTLASVQVSSLPNDIDEWHQACRYDLPTAAGIRLDCAPTTEGFTAVDAFPDALGDPLAAPEKYARESIVQTCLRMQGGSGWVDSWSHSARDVLRRKRWLFSARGHVGVLAVENIDFPLSRGVPQFVFRFRFNDRVGERGLEADGRSPEPVAEKASVAPDAKGPLLARTGTDSAIFFGMSGEKGSCLPASMRDKRIRDMKGIRHLTVDEGVAVIPEKALSGSSALETLEIRGQLKSIESRAFADCPKLSCVTLCQNRPFELVEDAFSGCSPNLTCHYTFVPSSRFRDGRSVDFRHPFWKRVVYYCKESAGERDFVEGDIFWREHAGGVRALACLGKGDTAVVPATIHGLPVVSVGWGIMRTGLKQMYFRSASTGCESMVWNIGDATVFVSGTAFQRIGHHAWSGQGRKLTVVPDDMDPEALFAGCVAETNGYKFVTRRDEAVVLRYKGKDEGVEVPSALGGKPVTEIWDRAFAGKPVKRIVLPPSVVRIGDGAFAGCVNLESVVLLGKVERIAAGAFFDCRELTELKLPESVRHVGYFAFEGMPFDPKVPAGATKDELLPSEKKQSGTQRLIVGP